MTPNVLLVILATIATYRMTRYLTGDKIGEPIRRWAKSPTRRPRVRSWLGYLVTCDWCVSTYVGAAWSAVIVLNDAAVIDDDWLWFAAMWFAFSGVTGLLASIEQWIDNRSRRDLAEARAVEKASGLSDS